MTIGARPSEISSQSSRRGFDISARPIAAICCWPPDKRWRAAPPLLQHRKQLIDRVSVHALPPFATRLPISEIFLDAERRESSRPSGTIAMPRLTISAATRADRPPSKTHDRGLAASRPQMARRKVELPAPLAPMIATVSPASIGNRCRTGPGNRRSGRSGHGSPAAPFRLDRRDRDRFRAPRRYAITSRGSPSASRPKFRTASRETTASNAWTICSIQMIVMPEA